MKLLIPEQANHQDIHDGFRDHLTPPPSTSPADSSDDLILLLLTLLLLFNPS